MSGEAVPKQVFSVHFGFRGDAREGFIKLDDANEPPWSANLFAEAKRLATLDSDVPKAGPSHAEGGGEALGGSGLQAWSGERFWSGFYSYCILVRYKEIKQIKDKVLRDGSFDVQFLVVPSGPGPISAVEMARGKAVALDRAAVLEKASQFGPEALRLFILRLCLAISRKRAADLLETCSLAQTADLAAALFSEPMVRHVDFVSSAGMEKAQKGLGQLVLAAGSPVANAPAWAEDLARILVNAVRGHRRDLVSVLEILDGVEKFQSLESLPLLLRAWVDLPSGVDATKGYVGSVLSSEAIPSSLKQMACERAIGHLLECEGPRSLIESGTFWVDWFSADPDGGIVDELLGAVATALEKSTLNDLPLDKLLGSAKTLKDEAPRGGNAPRLRAVLLRMADNSGSLEGLDAHAWAERLQEVAEDERDLPRLHQMLVARIWKEHVTAGQAKRESLLRLRRGVARHRADLAIGKLDLHLALNFSDDSFLSALQLLRDRERVPALIHVLKGVIGRHAEAIRRNKEECAAPGQRKASPEVGGDFQALLATILKGAESLGNPYPPTFFRDYCRIVKEGQSKVLERDSLVVLWKRIARSSKSTRGVRQLQIAMRQAGLKTSFSELNKLHPIPLEPESPWWEKALMVVNGVLAAFVVVQIVGFNAIFDPVVAAISWVGNAIASLF